ncbi:MULTISPECIES: chromate resistance protein ChrB domain-containing protein [unclassified Mesorhizobium]|uniref:chromate resistance protein ChrB domain-containing protein n=1 Tax=unclassified Mesorhizobium TaxID=325217 RepID=UPI001FE0FFBB|nr:MULTISPECIES: chromate resistance protein ChrB domain-containing protein [unclassified Mesorhizobium]
MKWVTRERPVIDRIACPWLIARFIDKDPEFLFVAPDQVVRVAQETGATPYDVPNVEFTHVGDGCSFDTFVSKYGLDSDSAIVTIAAIVRGGRHRQARPHPSVGRAAGHLDGASGRDTG